MGSGWQDHRHWALAVGRKRVAFVDHQVFGVVDELIFPQRFQQAADQFGAPLQALGLRAGHLHL